MKVAIISPHFDDAVFSLGGLISMIKDNKADVINVFCVTNFIYGHTDTSENGSILRNHEDELCLQNICNSRINLGYKEILLRHEFQKHGKIFLNKDSLALLESSYYLREKLYKSLKSCFQTNRYDVILFPMGIGGHIDHLLVSEIGNLFENVLYYYEIPYSCRIKRKNANPSNTHSLSQIFFHESIYQKHIELMSKYKTQFQPKYHQEVSSYLLNYGYLFSGNPRIKDLFLSLIEDQIILQKNDEIKLPDEHKKHTLN